MSFEPNLDGPFAPRVATGDESPGWPVLARLPLVGPRAAMPGERLPTYAALEPPAVGVRAAAPLRIVDPLPAESAGDATAMPLGMRIDPPQQRGRAPLIEPPQPPPSRREQYRVDPAESRQRGSYAARRQADDSMAARVARWHAAVGPSVGVAVTAALILAASLLYWVTVGRQRLALDGDDLLDSQNSWSSEAPMGPPVGAIVPSLETQVEELTAPLSSDASPRVADAAAAAPEAAATAPVKPAEPKDGPDLGPGSSLPSPAAVEPAPPVVAMPITPTPHDLPYPSTDYPWFEFSLAPAGAGASSATASSAAAGSAGEERPQ